MNTNYKRAISSAFWFFVMIMGLGCIGFSFVLLLAVLMFYH